MEFTEIDYSVADGIATIVLDREARMNAFTGRMCDELVGACDAIDADDAVRALVITGRGRAFCAGADLGGGGSTFDARGREKAERYGEVNGVGRDRGGVVALRFAALTVPVIAAINGPAVGRRRDDDAAHGRPHRRRRRRASGSSSRAGASCPRPRRAGSSRASSASRRRWSGR